VLADVAASGPRLEFEHALVIRTAAAHNNQASDRQKISVALHLLNPGLLILR
jgi:hypothetical protein